MNKLNLKIVDSLKKKEFFKFCLIGGFCAFQNTLILYILTSILHLHYVFSILLQMFYVNTLGFYLNNRYTFTNDKNQYWQSLLKYYAVGASSFVLVCALMYLLVDIIHIWYLFAFIILTIGMTFYNFIIHSRWTFK